MPRKRHPSSFSPEYADVFVSACEAPEHSPFQLTGTGSELIYLRQELYAFRKALQLDTKSPESQRAHQLYSTCKLVLRAPDGSKPLPSQWNKLRGSATTDLSAEGWTLTFERGPTALISSLRRKNPHFRTAAQRFEQRLATASSPNTSPLPFDEPEEPSEFASTLSDYFKPENL